MSWFSVDPREEIARLTIPTLIIQGTRDVQVSELDARSLARARPKSKLVIIEGMTHVLNHVEDDAALQQISFSDPSLRMPRSSAKSSRTS